MADRRSFLLFGGALALSPLSAPSPTVAAARSDSAAHAALDRWNRAEVVPLWPQSPPGGAHYAPQKLPADWPPVFIRNISMPALHVFRPTAANASVASQAPASNGLGLLVIPGGAYLFVSIANEGVEIAERMNALGFTVFVLTYRMPGEGWAPRADVPLQDAQRALRLIRSRAKAFGIDADKVTVVGFSAGGHLAGTLATRHAEKTYAGLDSADEVSARPFAAGLIYPVVTMMKPWTHEFSRDQLLGPNPTDEAIASRSVDMLVDGTTPPMFLAHACDDTTVPVENSLRLMNALRAATRPVEAHFFQEGEHAFGVGRQGTSSASWTGLFDLWVRRLVAAGSKAG